MPGQDSNIDSGSGRLPGRDTTSPTSSVARATPPPTWVLGPSRGPDLLGSNDTVDYYIHIEWEDGASCTQWELIVEGHQCN